MKPIHVFAFVLLTSVVGFAQPATPLPLDAVKVIQPADLGKITFTQSNDGVEADLGAPRIMWGGAGDQLDWPGLFYGDSKVPGKRYLRIAWERPSKLGTVLTVSGGLLSVLKPGVAAPGNIADDSQWIPAQRLHAGVITDAEAGKEDVAIWTLPSEMTTQALRFTHVAEASDKRYAGWLAGVLLLPGRLANMAPQAAVMVKSNPELAPLLNDESRNASRPTGPWASIRVDPNRRMIEEEPEWIAFVWPKPVTLQGLGGIEVGFGSADIQTYTGPANKSPKLASESDWKTVQSFSGLKCHYPLQLDLNWMPLDALLTTRAIRIRMTAALNEDELHPHRKGQTDGGRRVWLQDLVAVQDLGKAALASVVPPVHKVAEVHAPIPIHFTLPEDGNVTLVIEDEKGMRVRNLIADTPMKKGENTIYWDGTNDISRDPDAAAHGLYTIPVQFVDAGKYTVRGLWHKPIDLRYVLCFYGAGDPPWPTEDTTGGWMTTHTPATSVAFVPGAKGPGGVPVMLVGCYIAEGGSGLSWVNPEGKKIGGRTWIGGTWTGAQYLATDNGKDAEPGVSAYAGASTRADSNGKELGALQIRLTKLGGDLTSNGDKPVLSPVFTDDDTKAPNRDTTLGLGGLAVHNGLLVFSMPMLDQLVFVDAKKGQVLGKALLAKCGALAFDNQGRLLVLADKTLFRYTLSPSPQVLSAPEKVVGNLEDPEGITTDISGKIYISDRGNSNQVKVYSPDGLLTMAYGQAGPVVAGPYNTQHMNSPKGISIDGSQRLWVTEEDFQPKRVSVWNTDGSLWKTYYGPPQYGGGGVIDPHDATKLLYNGMEFKIDLAKGQSDLARVYYRPSSNFSIPGWGTASPEMPAYFHGKRYLTNIFNSAPTNGTNVAVIFLDKGDIAVPVAAAGLANDWDILKGDAFRSVWPSGVNLAGDPWQNNFAFFTWSDLNGDGQIQPNEVKMTRTRSFGVTLGDDGSFLVATYGPNEGPFQAMRFKPVSFTDKDAPVYDIGAGEVVAPANQAPADGGGQMLVGTDGWTVQTTAPPPFWNYGLGGSKDGKGVWSYPSLWPGLHPSHSCPPADHPGELLGTTRLLGNLVTPKGSNIGPLFVINGNQGDMYCFTQDGLFVTQFFQDVRSGRLWEMPSAQPNMLLNDLTLHDENFFPAVSQTPDGQIYLTAGAFPVVVRPDGLETLRRIDPIPLKIDSDDLKRGHEFSAQVEAARQAAAGNGVMNVPIDGAALVVDGHLDDWKNVEWTQIDKRGVAAYFDSNTKPYDVAGALQISNGKLYAAWKTGDANLLHNSGTVPNGLFKTGGALDLMIGANPGADANRLHAVEGDSRLLITQVNGKTRAVLYRPVVPGTDPKNKVPFAAPWHSISIDRVDDVSDKVELATDGAGNYEISVPLDLLRLEPAAGTKIKGDMGILRGNGTETTQRVYWSNKSTAIVSDVPSEAELTPNLWGIWEFKAGN